MKTKETSLLIFLQGGNYEIIKELSKNKEPLQFKNLRDIQNPKTSKKFSSSTIASSIKSLEDYGIIQSKITKNKGRKVLGYELTDSGNKTYLILKEAEEKLYKI